jgi:hypothetical protein
LEQGTSNTIKHRAPPSPPAAGLAMASTPAPPEAHTGRGTRHPVIPRPNTLRPEAPWRQRRRMRAHAADRRSVGRVAVVCAPPERRSTAEHLRRHASSPADAPGRIFKRSAPSRAPAPSRRRHCRRRPVLELAAGPHRRPANLLASLAPSEAHAVACLPAFRPHAVVHRATTAAATSRRQTSPPANSPPPLPSPTASR